jgi:hypothetical protein
MRIVNLNLNSSVWLTINECLTYWKKARIPTQDRDNCSKKFKKNYIQSYNIFFSFFIRNKHL